MPDPSANSYKARLDQIESATQSPEPDYGFGFRYNSQDPKGLGYFGNLQRPDGTGFMGEYSITVDLNGQPMEIPSMVPTLTKDEVQHILTMKEGDRIPRSIQTKAIEFAKQRLAAGLPVFARTGEQQGDLHPELARAPVPVGRPQAPPMMPSHPSYQERLQSLAQMPLAVSH
jgi:hypothetical protein